MTEAQNKIKLNAMGSQLVSMTIQLKLTAVAQMECLELEA